MSVKRVPASLLIVDHSVYPRESIDDRHIGRLAEALEAGATLPPIVVDKDSERIVDGVHRRYAHQRVGGDDVNVSVEYRTYQSEADLFADAIELNAPQKRSLTGQDISRIVIRSQALGMSVDRVAGLLNVPVDKLQRRTLIGYPITRRPGVTTSKVAIPLKQTMAPFAGKRLTPAQVTANQKAGGMSAVFYVRQVAMLIEANALDLEDEQLVGELRRLVDLLDELKLPVAAA